MLKQLLKYLRYVLTAKTKHGIHSPFIFDLVTKVFNDKKEYYSYKTIESYRKELLLNRKEIEIIDLGAGSKKLTTNKRKISAIAARSLKRAKYAQLLFRLVEYVKPKTILELGTSLGITTLYLASAKTEAKVITIEGSETIAKEAQELFKKADAKNITSVVGDFNSVLVSSIEKYCRQSIADCRLDFIFIDGNHRKEPTLNYFKQILNYVGNDSILIFDDIHWSDEMEQAWAEIKKHPQVTTTIDLFEIGIVFFRKELSKEDFVIRY